MNCDQATELLCARLGDELTADDRLALEAHLAECATCRATAEAFQSQDADLRRAFASRRRAVAAVAERVIIQVRASARPRREFLMWITPLLSAAAGFLLAVGIFRPWEKPIVPPSTDHVVSTPRETLQLTLATGPVEMKPAGQDAWQALPTGQAIEAGACVRTPDQCRCELRTADGSEVRLNSDTEVTFQPRSPSTAAGSSTCSAGRCSPTSPKPRRRLRSASNRPR
jgi:hypothetical protein